jgi:prolyl-tRNA synthetase
VVVINTKIDAQVDAGNALYEQLSAAGIDVLLDDRDERAGVKFNDMDLIGIPLRITVGKTLENGQIELKARNDKTIHLVDLANVVTTVKSFL